MTRSTVAGTTTLLVLLLAGCSDSAETVDPPSAASPTATQAIAQAFTIAERSYLDALPGGIGDGRQRELVNLGQGVCRSTDLSTTAIAETITGSFNSTQATAVVTAATEHLCPGREFADPNAISDGTYEVGVDVEPGKYKTPGGSDSCYWARLRANDGASGDIIDNSLAVGPQTVTINAGEYFETRGCGTWTLTPA